MSQAGFEELMDGVAIVGMACRFPGAHNVEAFWQNLRQGVESVSFFRPEELEKEVIDPAELSDPHYVPARATLDEVESFDAALFGFTPREAELTDPQHRLFMECVWEALEHAGYTPDKFPGSIGLYGGAGANTYMLFHLASAGQLLGSIPTLQAFIHNKNDHLTTRTAYKLNLRGPSVTVQTACSTSLVAVATAAQSLLNYQCDMALAGGVTITVPQRTGYLYHERGIGSPDGHCRPFDAQAAGTVGGNGAGIVALKRVEDALADGDTIYAVIRGWAINNDGSNKVGYTAPRVSSQAAVIALAQALADVDADTISYVEAHGTGTPIGDPMEIEALTQAFRRRTERTQFCAIGSVKGNIGHLDTAAGIAGLIKTTLALTHKQLPPSLHYRTPNPVIDFANSPFFVNQQLRDWHTNGSPRRAGISAFGLGGTNAHAVLEEAPPRAPSGPARPWHLLMLSAKSASALEQMTHNLVVHLRAHPELSLPDVAHTLQVGRKSLEHRRFLLCRDLADAAGALDTLAPERVFSRQQEAATRPLTFMFPGQGAQHPNMGADLYRHEPTFRETVDRCCEILQPHLGLDLRTLLYPTAGGEEAAAEQLNQTRITQPALFVIEYAMAQQWMAWGLQPQSMMGHSIGEYVAACLAGVFSLEDALFLVAERGRLIQGLPAGAMLSVPLSERDILPLLGETLSLAAVNGLEQSVVAGPPEAIDELEARLTARKLICRRLHTSHAFHSRMMEPILEAFRAIVAQVERHAPQIPYLSNLTGGWITEEQATDPAYWSAHIRQSVRFADELAEVLREPDAVLLEVGPGRTLRTLARWHPHKQPNQFMVASLPHPTSDPSDYEFLLNTIGNLWLAGIEVDWRTFYAHEQRQRLPLPTYPFERKRYWVDLQPLGQAARPKPSLTKKATLADWFYLPTWREQPLPAAPPAAPSTLLLFEDGTGLGTQLATRARAEGTRVIRVQPGEFLELLNEGHYLIDPQSTEEYRDLLAAAGEGPLHILHAWGVTHDEPASLEEALTRGFYSLISLAQALGEQGSSRPVTLTVLSTGTQAALGTESLSPAKATVLGACRVIPREYPFITCRQVDLTLPPSGSWQEARLTADLLHESTLTDGDPVVAYRHSRRWVQGFTPHPLPEGNALRPQGTYLITGGLGGLGLEVAAYLAETVQARLVLLGRSAPTDAQRQRLAELERRGARILTLQADVTDEAQMRRAIEQARTHFGPIHGVFHAAGVAGGGLIQRRPRELMVEVMAPKVQGTAILERLFGAEELDFILLFSSLTTVVGRLGQADYSAANAYLDAFAHAHATRSSSPVLAVNWGAWGEVGMAAHPSAPAGKVQVERLSHPMLDRRVQISPQHEIFLTDFNVARHWVLDGHRILGHPVVPGVAYFEMVRAALGERAVGRVVELQDVFFLQPLRVRDDETKETQLHLTQEEDGTYRFVVRSPGDEPGSPMRDHTMGRVVLPEAAPLTRYDLDALRQRCNLRELLLAAEEREEDLGPRWHSVQRVHIGTNEVLIYLELPEAFHSDFEQMKFHPALLDRAAGIAKNFLAKEGHHLPLTHRNVQIKAPLQPRIYSYARFRADEARDNNTITFDIILMDEQGHGLVEIEGFTQKRVDDPGAELRALATPTGQSNGGESKQPPPPNEVKPREAILPHEGCAALGRILAARLPQVIVSAYDLRTEQEQSDTVVRERIQAAAGEPQAAARTLHPRPNLNTPYVAPRNEMEQKVAGIWQQVLGIERVGIHDNFFDLGGDSLVVIQAVALLERALQVEIPPVLLFEGANIAALVERFAATPAPVIEEEDRGERRRSQMQERAAARRRDRDE